MVMKIIKKIPIISVCATRVGALFENLTKSFPGSQEYWEQRYQQGGNSGAGSYSLLAEFKADILNTFVECKKIEKVIEYGCGDGNQLGLSKYSSYLGFDVSPAAISQCAKIFSEDLSKVFKLISEYSGESAQLTLSLDVIYHLIEDDLYSDYMERLFTSSTQFVIIYASNYNSKQLDEAPHVRHRQFTSWVKANQPQWELMQYIPNKYPYMENDNGNGSFADFYIYHKVY